MPRGRGVAIERELPTGRSVYIPLAVDAGAERELVLRLVGSYEKGKNAVDGCRFEHQNESISSYEF